MGFQRKPGQSHGMEKGTGHRNCCLGLRVQVCKS